MLILFIKQNYIRDIHLYKNYTSFTGMLNVIMFKENGNNYCFNDPVAEYRTTIYNLIKIVYIVIDYFLS